MVRKMCYKTITYKVLELIVVGYVCVCVQVRLYMCACVSVCVKALEENESGQHLER